MIPCPPFGQEPPRPRRRRVSDDQVRAALLAFRGVTQGAHAQPLEEILAPIRAVQIAAMRAALEAALGCAGSER